MNIQGWFIHEEPSMNHITHITFIMPSSTEQGPIDARVEKVGVFGYKLTAKNWIGRLILINRYKTERKRVKNLAYLIGGGWELKVYPIPPVIND